jgi:hypothetical protein
MFKHMKIRGTVPLVAAALLLALSALLGTLTLFGCGNSNGGPSGTELTPAEEAAEFIGQNPVLDTPAADISSLADVVAVGKALAAYDVLSTEAKAQVSAETKGKLEALQTRIVSLVKDNTVLGKTLTGENAVALSDEAAVEQALGIYNALSDSLKALLADEKAYLDNLLAKINTLTKPPAVTPITIGLNKGVVTVKKGDETITVTPGVSAFTLSKSGSPGSITLSTTGFTGGTWYLDGSTTAKGTGLSITLNAASDPALDARGHSITFTGLAGAVPKSIEIPFTVEN